MSQMVLPAVVTKTPGQAYHVSIYVQADVLDPEVVRRKANVWMGMNVGNLLAAEKPELILGEQLRWRFDVLITQPNLAAPGTGFRRRVAHILLDAYTGEIIDPDAFMVELSDNAIAAAT